MWGLMMNNFFYCIVFLIGSAGAFAFNYQTIPQDIFLHDTIDWTNSFITILMDASGNKYVVKQLKCERKISWAKIICEVVALEVGHAIGVPQNYVALIPAGVPFMGKDLAVPATVHTYVPGVRFDVYPRDVFPNLAIKQRDHYGRRTGLTRDLIYQMSRHKDLPALVALDTFVNNPARHKHNLFYEEQQDTFYGIDMGASFHKDLCKRSLKTIKTLLQNKKSLLSHAEGQALWVYCQTLKKLVVLYNPSELCYKLDRYAQYGGLFDDRFFDINIQKVCCEYLEQCKKVIHESDVYVNQLIDALEQLLKQRKFKKMKAKT